MLAAVQFSCPVLPKPDVKADLPRIYGSGTRSRAREPISTVTETYGTEPDVLRALKNAELNVYADHLDLVLSHKLLCPKRGIRMTNIKRL